MYKIGIIGINSLVGGEILEILKEDLNTSFPITEMFLFDEKADGNELIDFKEDKKLKVRPIDEAFTAPLDIIFTCSDIKTSQELMKKQVFEKCIFVIDTTGAFNPEKYLASYKINSKNLITKTRTNNVISLPLSISVGIAAILNPVKEFVKRVVISTYQPVSRLNKSDGISALCGQIGSVLQEQEIEKEDKILKNIIAFNANPEFNETSSNYETQEEVNIKKEVEILLNQKINISVSSVMIPSLFGDAVTMNIEFKDDIEDFNIAEIIAKICFDDQVTLMNNDENNTTYFPTPFDVSYSDNAFIGKIREDKTVKHGIDLWGTWGNIRFAKALNAVNIAKILVNKKPV